MKNLHYLIVEDSSTMRKMTTNSLKRFDVPDTSEAENGLKALEKLKYEHIDFIITDWNMPVMDGLSFVKNVRKLPNHHETPILMITSRGVREDVLNAMKSGVNNYVVKPFNALTLKSKIEKILKKSRINKNLYSFRYFGIFFL